MKFDNEGIRHETSYPYAPQQNGLVEKKIGELMDQCRTLMEQAKIPKHLQGFSTRTRVQLANRLHTLNLQLRSPIEILETVFPTFRLRTGLTPKVFGCVSYFPSHNLSGDKLSAKALKCMFVGYFFF